jgi:hypothetical protein
MYSTCENYKKAIKEKIEASIKYYKEELIIIKNNKNYIFECQELENIKNIKKLKKYI